MTRLVLPGELCHCFPIFVNKPTCYPLRLALNHRVVPLMPSVQKDVLCKG